MKIDIRPREIQGNVGLSNSIIFLEVMIIEQIQYKRVFWKPNLMCHYFIDFIIEVDAIIQKVFI